jgi:(p)ppGpp synthase/HD superfamily hydrolase
MDNKSERLSYNQVINLLRDQLLMSGITAEISGRIKDPYSILQKLTRKLIQVEQLSDIIAFRVIVNHEDQCYKTLDIIQKHYEVIPEKYKDYIDLPKANGYQSLHTVIIIGSFKRSVEIQIRTKEMHNLAENGDAAHCKYKKENQEQQLRKFITSENFNILTRAYELLDPDNLTEPALLAYSQEIADIWNAATTRALYEQQ